MNLVRFYQLDIVISFWPNTTLTQFLDNYIQNKYNRRNNVIPTVMLGGEVLFFVLMVLLVLLVLLVVVTVVVVVVVTVVMSALARNITHSLCIFVDGCHKNVSNRTLRIVSDFGVRASVLSGAVLCCA